MSHHETKRPQFVAGEAGDLIQALYGLSGIIQELPSERDQNFYLREKGGREFVLKISAAAEKKEVLEFQDEALARLGQQVPGYDWPKIWATRAGEAIGGAEHRSGSSHFARLVSYLPGRFLAQVRPHKPELLESLGVFLGSMDKAFSSFSHPAMHRELKWNMKKGLETTRRLLPHVESLEGRELVESFLKRYEEHVVPVLPQLRTSVIHNDANDHNVLVGHASSAPEGRFSRVCGIIDFGDMLHGYTAVELAVGAAYAIMGKPNPLAAACPIVSGYHSVLPLSEIELEILYDLIALRLCLSVFISAEQKKQEFENDYLTISEKPAWALLGRWHEINPRLAYYAFRRACHLPPCPQTAAIIGWLKDNRHRLSPIVNADFKKTPPLVFDLSVGSRELSPFTEPCDMEKLTELLLERMRCPGAAVGIGRYDEARRFYSSDAFKKGGNDAPEWRTVHLGIDLYMSPGSPVLAALDGAVHSFQNNRNSLDYGPTVILRHSISNDSAFYTLYGHLSEDSLAGQQEGKLIKKGEVVGRVGNMSENGGWPPHLHFQIIADLLGQKGDFIGVAPASERDLWLSLCPDPNLILKIPEDFLRPGTPERDRAELINLRRHHLGPNLSITYKKPLKIVRGFMQYLYDENGQRYLDAVNNVPHVGHCHPRVVRAAQEQAAVLNTNSRYLHDHIVEYALRLIALLPEPLRVFYFVSSGSEANDLALRLARTHTGKRDTIVIDGAYHGHLTSLIEISPYKFDGPGGLGAPPHVHKIPTPDGYRGIYKHSDSKAGGKYARFVQEAIEKIQEQGRGGGAFVCESLMGSSGQIVYPPGFLKEAFSHVRRAGGVCVVDEVQVGFGRVGSHFWGFETQGVVPDIVTMGKPIGNGHPLAAVVTTPEIAASFNTGMEYFSTFGGNPVSCGVGLAVLDVIRDENLQENAREVGSYFKRGLEKLSSRHALIGEVRGLGLFLGIELVLDRETLVPATAEASYVAERMKEKGILISTDGPYRNVLKIKPPLCFTKSNADFFIETLDEVLSEDSLKDHP